MERRVIQRRGQRCGIFQEACNNGQGVESLPGLCGRWQDVKGIGELRPCANVFTYGWFLSRGEEGIALGYPLAEFSGPVFSREV
jgi:hypothetical protein